MAVRIDLTFDCSNPLRLAEFWKLALGYEDEPPPAPYATRAEWLEQFDLSANESADDGAWLHDPGGVGPRLSLLRVPEPKVAKNRLHMDVRVSAGRTGPERWEIITATAQRLTAAGAGVVEEFPGHHIVMADPEGNEFCVC